MTRYDLRTAAALVVTCLFEFALPVPAAAQTSFPLTIHMSGTTNGRVGVVPGGGLCDVTGGGTNTCTYFIASGSAVRLSGNSPQTPGLFSGGTGPAASCGFSACSFTMTAAADVNVNFNPANGTIVSLTTTLSGDGRGTVGVDNSRCQNIDLVQGNGCTTHYLQGSPVAAGAAAGPGARFSTFSAGTAGAEVCGASAACNFTITGTATLTATFRAIASLTVTPPSALKAVGGPGQVFTAVGTFTDGVTEQILPGMGAWVTVTPLPNARYSLGAVSHGGFVYAIGGIQSAAPAATVTQYNPSTLSWSARAPMPTPREGLGVAAIDSFIYAVGGNTTGSTPVATLERFDPAANTWSALAPMSAPRRFLAAAAASNGKLYAVGGETVSGVATTVGTVEEYDPATNTWTTKASMPTPRKQFSLVAIDGLLYAVGGSTTALEVYDPAANTWTTKTPLPFPMNTSAAAAADGVLYVMGGFSTLAYDVAWNTWAFKLNIATGRTELAAAAQDGIVYALGGLTTTTPAAPTPKAETFIESLRWSSAQPSVATITQQGSASAVGLGTTAINASVGSFLCTSCATLTSFTSFPTDMALGSPSNGSVVTAGGTFDVTGWALNRGAPDGMGTGVDTVHVYAMPSSGAPIFLGVATYGLPRPDVGAIFGSQFTNSGFSLTTGSSLATGPYTIVAYAHDALSDAFNVFRTANVIVQAPVSHPFIDMDTPRDNAVVTSSFEVGGWALDAGAPAGTGVDMVVFYVFPNDGASPGVYIGQGSYGLSRPDVGAIFGSQFTNAGFHYTISGLGPGAFMLGVYARSTVTGTFSIVKTIHFTVNATALMALNPPAAEAVITPNIFNIDGWSIDRAIEGTALSGSGVDTLHVYAYPNPGSGAPPIFLGVATVGLSRPDVAALYGSRYGTSGYHLSVDRSALGLPTGPYNIVVHSHSTVTGTFNNAAVVRVTLQ
jgi:N-acetylneuraminic acid mutarotase